jgi:hypothetical protein
VSNGLTPRPELSPEDVAAVIAAAQNHFAQRAEGVPDVPPVWRFSGRWFSTQTLTNRRSL